MTAKMYYDNDADPSALAGQTVAKGALVLVYLCASQKIRFIRRHLRIRVRLLVEVRVQRRRREFPL